MKVLANGIDVSKYQGSIDWKQVKAAGYTFAIVRMGWINGDGAAGGTITVDPYFDSNMRNAAAAGVDVGIYLYSYARTAAQMSAAAASCIAKCKAYTVTMPIVLDYEYATLYKNFNKALNNQLCSAFLDTVEKAGYFAMLYTYKSFANSYLNMSGLAKYSFWLAEYTSRENPTYTGSYGMWQYSSSGNVAGIAGRVDMNRMYVNYPAIIKAKGMNNTAKPVLYNLLITGASKGDANALKAQADSLGLACVMTQQ